MHTYSGNVFLHSLGFFIKHHIDYWHSVCLELRWCWFHFEIEQFFFVIRMHVENFVYTIRKTKYTCIKKWHWLAACTNHDSSGTSNSPYMIFLWKIVTIIVFCQKHCAHHLDMWTTACLKTISMYLKYFACAQPNVPNDC